RTHRRRCPRGALHRQLPHGEPHSRGPAPLRRQHPHAGGHRGEGGLRGGGGLQRHRLLHQEGVHLPHLQ
ncbi:Transposon-encoded protein TnpV, partial [Dysosmobacter welbionis]